MITRAEHMSMPYTSSEAERRARHRAYYAQFVNGSTIAVVVRHIGESKLRASTDPNLNDIPLAMWDRLAPGLPGSGKFGDAGDIYTLSGGVCLAKEAARQWLDAQNITQLAVRVGVQP